MKKVLSLSLITAVLLTNSISFSLADEKAAVPTSVAGSSWVMVGETTEAKMIAPDYYNNITTYKYDEKTLENKVKLNKNALFKVDCNVANLLKDFWINNDSIFSFSLEKDGKEYYFDKRNCSLNINRINQNYSYDTLSKSEALKLAEDFVKSELKGKSYFFDSLWEAKVISNNYAVMYAKEATLDSTAGADYNYNNIEVIEDQEENVEPQSQSFSVFVPMLINKVWLYNNYGNQIWVTLTVDKNGVSNVSVPLLKFKLIKKAWEKMNLQDYKDFISKWGMSPYYNYRTQTKELNLNKVENVFILFSLWQNNKNENYLSTGLRLESDVKSYEGAYENYGINISDYKIWNNLNY